MDAQKGGKLCYCQRFDFVRIKPKEERFHFVPESEFIVSLLVPDIAEYNSDFLKMKTGDHDVNSCETSFFYVGLWLIEVCYKMFLQLTSLGRHIGKMIVFAKIDRVIHEDDKMFSFNLHSKRRILAASARFSVFSITKMRNWSHNFCWPDVAQNEVMIARHLIDVTTHAYFPLFLASR